MENYTIEMSDTLTKDKIDALLETVVTESKTLLLHNDEHNSFEWVIECLIDICGHSSQQAEQCAMITHFKGKCSVKEGSHDILKPLKDGLNDRGLSVTIE